jgi:hypothetical protein
MMTNMTRIIRIVVTLAFMRLATACGEVASPRVHLGAPGESVTHVTVEVTKGAIVVPVWRLRCGAQLGEAASEVLLPRSPPRQPLEFPETYNVTTGDKTGRITVEVEGLDADGVVVGRAQGAVDLRRNAGVNLPLVLGRACLGDTDCGDGAYCNGPETCLEQACVGGLAPCPPSPHACVEVTCLEEEERCNVTARHDLCPALPEGGVDLPRYCDGVLGCVVGVLGAPALEGEPEVSPSTVTLANLVRVSFRVSEPLDLDHPPVVLLDVGGGRRAPFSQDHVASDPLRLLYVYDYAVDGTEAPGSRQVTVDLVDRTGAAAHGLNGGTVLIDFAPPGFLGTPTVDPAFIRVGQNAELRFRTSEPVSILPEVWMTPGADPSAAGIGWTADEPGQQDPYHHTLLASQGHPEGIYSVWVRLVADLIRCSGGGEPAPAEPGRWMWASANGGAWAILHSGRPLSA